MSPARVIVSLAVLIAIGFALIEVSSTWVCAHDVRRIQMAAALLASAHLVFWRVVLDEQFVSVRLPGA
jgi:hypothetical protein